MLLIKSSIICERKFYGLLNSFWKFLTAIKFKLYIEKPIKKSEYNCNFFSKLYGLNFITNAVIWHSTRFLAYMCTFEFVWFLIYSCKIFRHPIHLFLKHHFIIINLTLLLYRLFSHNSFKARESKCVINISCTHQWIY